MTRLYGRIKNMLIKINARFFKMKPLPVSIYFNYCNTAIDGLFSKIITTVFLSSR